MNEIQLIHMIPDKYVSHIDTYMSTSSSECLLKLQSET